MKCEKCVVQAKERAFKLLNPYWVQHNLPIVAVQDGHQEQMQVPANQLVPGGRRRRGGQLNTVMIATCIA